VEAALVHQGLMRRRHWLAAGAGAALAACAWPPAGEAPPPVPREFRAAWVATVAHIDWPSRPGLPAAAQRAEMQALLDRAVAIGLNALVLQVRPAADAIYPSALEPWSEYLTGASGQPPDEPWDPLAEWVDGAHRRGLELHAWFNPYRARHPSARSEPGPTHVAQAEPAIVKRYGDFLWMDPAEPRAAQRMVDVVLDVLQRYDIDGVHIDDYFYPYPVPDGRGGELPFPDEPSWQRHLAAGGDGSDRDAWRRAQVDALIERLYRAIHAAKPWVRFGISPFGLPRPDRRPPGIEGFSQFHKLHADVERWLAEGWLDYLAPQLYWPRAQAPQAFAVLQAVWHAGNARVRHVWPGLFTSRLGAERNAYDADEVLAQVALTRRDRRGRRRPPALQHGGADGQPRRHRRPPARRALCRTGADAGHPLAGRGRAAAAALAARDHDGGQARCCCNPATARRCARPCCGRSTPAAGSGRRCRCRRRSRCCCPRATTRPGCWASAAAAWRAGRAFVKAIALKFGYCSAGISR
jgi:uncharacterized lipoprotein YddW (UPF0748 family)